MLLHHDHLFSGQEATEVAGVGLVGAVHGWDVTIPRDTLGAREQLPHEGLLTANLDLDVAIANLRRATVHTAVFEVLDSCRGLGAIFEFHVAVHGLAGRALHDDVDGIPGRAGRLVDQTSITANRSDNLVFGGTIGNL